MSFDPATYLHDIQNLPDGDINIALAALALCAPDHSGISFERYINHLKKMETDVHARHKALLDKGADDSAETCLAALKHILSDQEGYSGDTETYDDLQNADLIRVIDRRKGMPITLSILYIHVGRALGWDVAGLNMPGHFICRIEKDGSRLIFDPFDCAKILQASDLRVLLKKTQGEFAELAAEYFEPASSRGILVRLQNNLKLRLIENEEYEKALEIVEGMRLVDPDEFRLLLDAGVLYARVGQNKAAVRSLESYIDRAPGHKDRQEAAILLQQLRDRLN